MLPEPSAPADTLSVGVTETIDPRHAPYPTNGAERFVFSQLYEGLIAVDCAGAAVPLLAESWSSYDDGRQWTFRLRDATRFWNGSRVRARDVVSSWDPNALERLDIPRATVFAIGDTVVSLGSRASGAKIPLGLAHPELTVTQTTVFETSWPQGTGSFTVASDGDTNPNRIVLVPSGVSAHSGGLPVIVIRVTAGRDARDLIDQGVDLLFTNDPDALEYARSRSQLQSIPLPWDRTYVLLRTQIVAPTSMASSAGRDALARDAVRAEARGASGPFWWQELDGCHARVPTGQHRTHANVGNRIVSDASDPTARDLATRLAALSATRDGWRSVGATAPGPVVATSMNSTDFPRAARLGQELGYVTALPRLVLDACGAAADLYSTLPWLNDVVRLSDAIVPLVDTRRRVVARRGRVHLGVDFFGTPRLMPQ